MAQAPSPLSGIARALVQQGRLQEADAEAIQIQAQNGNNHFVQALVASKKLSALEVAEFASNTFGYPMLDLAQMDAAYIPSGVLDVKLMQSRRIAPLYKRGTKLFVAISDPTFLQALEDAKFQTGTVIEPVVVEDQKLGQLIEKLVEATGSNLKDMVVDQEDLNLAGGEEAAAEPDVGSAEVDDAPVVKYIQKILLDAINGGASDIHFEPYEKFYRIRYRIDGVLREIATPPLAIKDKMSSRIKVISKLDISEKRVPQDGRMRLVLSKTRAIDFRVSTLPTLFGEKICMRILDPSSATLGIDALGYEPDQKAALLEAVHRPYGMVLVTGPTGSGKTVSLYTCLNILNEPGINISTAEDPAEINLPGINQVNVNDKAGLTFAAALKSFLRQDPDIIMVGEIRDLETADISIKAAQTGHMVFSTLHTNDAPATLSRMLNMGIAPFNIASSVILITGQRLARKLCTACKKPLDIPPEALLSAGFSEEDLDGSWQPYGPVGCDICKGTGYKGRVGIYQVMPISEEMQRIIMAQGNSIDIADQAKREGVRDLRQSGLLKVKQGMTSLTEVEAVTNE
ncbi:type IV-A pilus assembly ATPase PilB [Chitinimonas arctica]|uniref:Type IV-A pilus assembly ATPase PilB n=1 Tax=Chitinimonas arctica TaxID=2594795 RepID=A0A516SDW9_9NEIS|nr:type IV-A pilus assembly ATPase PilB [Chitinimonas arctica]QDQ26349.1 type IV-A pilus assembly ATPase PilB [Chitinimonas arctica]